jgi:hypothetical protein
MVTEPKQKEILISGTGFQNYPMIFKFSNNLFNDVVKSRYISPSDLLVDFPQFQFTNVRYPINMKIDVSIDGGNTFISTNLKILLDNSSKTFSQFIKKPLRFILQRLRNKLHSDFKSMIFQLLPDH